jgi:hypothetical protein
LDRKNSYKKKFLLEVQPFRSSNSGNLCVRTVIDIQSSLLAASAVGSNNPAKLDPLEEKLNKLSQVIGNNKQRGTLRKVKSAHSCFGRLFSVKMFIC